MSGAFELDRGPQGTTGDLACRKEESLQRSEERREKKTRLKRKARQLSDSDLVTVMQMRQAQLAETPPDGKATAKQKAKKAKADEQQA